MNAVIAEALGNPAATQWFGLSALPHRGDFAHDGWPIDVLEALQIGCGPAGRSLASQRGYEPLVRPRSLLAQFLRGEVQMLRIREGSALAGAGAIAISVFAAPVSVVSLVVQSAPGGTYSESDVANYVSIGFLPTVIVTGYLALAGVLGLICLLAYLREVIGVEPGSKLAASVF